MKDWYGDDYRYVVLFYRADRFFGELHSSDEGEVWWEPLDNLKNLPLANDMDKMLRVFLEDDLSEYFFRPTGPDCWTEELK